MIRSINLRSRFKSCENYPKKLCARCFAVLKRTQEKAFVEVFIVKRLTNFQEGKNRTKILFETCQQLKSNCCWPRHTRGELI